MSLSTHAAVGAAVMVIARANPILAFIAAFMSHFILDSLPHKDYSIKALYAGIADPTKPNRFAITGPLIVDLSKVAFDVFLGVVFAIAVSLATGTPVWPFALVGAFAGMLPDALQVAYGMLPKGPLAALQTFHMNVHKYAEWKWNATAAWLSQGVVAAGAILLAGIIV